MSLIFCELIGAPEQPRAEAPPLARQASMHPDRFGTCVQTAMCNYLQGPTATGYVDWMVMSRLGHTCTAAHAVGGTHMSFCELIGAPEQPHTEAPPLACQAILHADCFRTTAQTALWNYLHRPTYPGYADWKLMSRLRCSCVVIHVFARGHMRLIFSKLIGAPEQPRTEAPPLA